MKEKELGNFPSPPPLPSPIQGEGVIRHGIGFPLFGETLDQELPSPGGRGKRGGGSAVDEGNVAC